MSKERAILSLLRESIYDSVDDLAQALDKELDSIYHYGLSKPGTFGYEANKATASFVSNLIRKGITDIEELASAAHEGWASTVLSYPDQPEEKKAKRMLLVDTDYSDLPEEEKEKDRVAARLILRLLSS